MVSSRARFRSMSVLAGRRRVRRPEVQGVRSGVALQQFGEVSSLGDAVVGLAVEEQVEGVGGLDGGGEDLEQRDVAHPGLGLDVLCGLARAGQHQAACLGSILASWMSRRWVRVMTAWLA